MKKSYETIAANESIKVDGKNWTIEANGMITLIVTIGFFILAGLYIYGKFFHVKVKEKVRSYNAKRRTRKSKTKK